MVRIVDGDTLVVLDGGEQQHKVRLAGIDCPERKQPWGQRAKQALSGYVFDRDVAVDWGKRDRYGRIVGKVLNGERRREPRPGQGRDVLVVPQVRG